MGPDVRFSLRFSFVLFVVNSLPLSATIGFRL